MSKQVITLSDRAANRVKEIIAKAKEPIIGVRVRPLQLQGGKK